MKTFFWIILAYLIGSIPWALIIGKTFFNKDIREYGSGNLGGTNAGRVLGKPIGIIVILLDAFKAFIFMIICHKFDPEIIVYGGLAVCFGHCFPIFAGFKGGKAVACSFGYLLGLSIYVTKDPLTLLVPLIVFFTIAIIFKYISLASMVALVSASIYAFFNSFKLGLILLFLSLFVIYRHKSNIIKLINHQEAKYSTPVKK